MTSTEFTKLLKDHFYGISDEITEQIVAFWSFEREGIRHNDGLIVRVADGSEFQITVVRSN